MEKDHKLELLQPSAERDAPFALSWFVRPEGKDTLLRMGNAEHEIPEPSLREEEKRIEEFIQLEAENKQITRMIDVDGVTVGAVWLELIEMRGVKPPSLHIMIGNPDYRGMGIGKKVMLEAIDMARSMGHKVIYTRHLTSNIEIKKLNDSLGFIDDGEPYTDSKGLTWQHIKLNLED